MNLHEDDRRVLLDWGDSETGTSKLIQAKQDCVLGHHYHKIKTERFLLVRGSCVSEINDFKEHMQYYKPINVLPGEIHNFRLTKGSILLCLCSHSYNPKDDYTV